MNADDHNLPAGGRIQVWNRYLGAFAGEFEIASPADDGGYHVRRSSDLEILPRPFAAEDIRPIM